MNKKQAIIIEPTKAYNFLFHDILINLIKDRDYTLIFLINSEKQMNSYLEFKNDNNIIINVNKKFEIKDNNLDIKDLYLKSIKYEKKYKFNYIRDILFQDRALSSFFLNYAPFYSLKPKKVKSLNAYYSIINECYDFAEHICKDFYIEYAFMRPDSIHGAPIVNVLEQNNCLVTVPVSARYKGYASWSYGGYREGDFMYSKWKNVETMDKEIINLELENTHFKQKKLYKSSEAGSLKYFFKELLLQLINRSIFLLQDLRKLKFSKRISFFSWLNQRLNGMKISNFFQKNSIKNSLQRDKNIATFFLSVQPEITSHSLSREFWDIKTMVQQVAASLPANYDFIVKEHSNNLGVRSINFYHELKKLPNLFFSPLSIDPIELIKKSDIVFSIGGTVGMEASLAGKPVISFTNRARYAFLDNIFYVHSLKDLPEIINEAIDFGSKNTQAIIKDTKKLYQANKENSFLALGTTIFRGDKTKLENQELEKAISILKDMKKFHTNNILNNES